MHHKLTRDGDGSADTIVRQTVDRVITSGISGGELERRGTLVGRHLGSSDGQPDVRLQ